MKYGKCLARISLILLISVFLGCASSRDMEIKGRATYTNGNPVVGGRLVLTRLASRPFSMPRPERIGTVTTDSDGGFNIVIKGVIGNFDIDIYLLSVKCRWHGNSIITSDKFSVEKVVHITTKPERCKIAGLKNK